MCRYSGEYSLIIISFLFPLLLYFFINGFLLNDHIVHELSSYDNRNINKPQINKLMLIVIDALRADFIFGQNHHLWTAIHDLNAKRYIHCENSKIEAPSVTLPRIKALTTGRVPQFYDILSNFGDTAMKSDTWLSILKNHDWNLQFYGDETWLRLFPRIFDKSDPVSSLFVTDYYEVDNNVTRHLKDVLPVKNEKSVIILHYLGLDHIGHVEGPQGESIQSKINEMNSVIKHIVEQFENSNDWMIIITGDHGMANEGGHGGASHSELLTSVLYVSPLFAQNHSLVYDYFEPKCEKSDIIEGSQLDITSLITSVTGIGSLPKSLGIISPPLMATVFKWDALKIAQSYNLELDVYLGKLHCQEDGSCINDIQLPQDIITRLLLTRVHFKSDFQKHCDHDENVRLCENEKNHSLLTHSFEAYKALRKTQAHFIKHSSEFSLFQMILFSSLMWLINFYIWFKFLKYIFSKMEQNLVILKDHEWSSTPWVKGLLKLSLILILGQALTLVSSSFVEEEHQFWYACNTSLTLLTLLPLIVWHYRHNFISKRLFLQDLFYGILLMIIDRILRKLYNTGDKWRHLPDFSDWLHREENGKKSMIQLTILSLIIMTILRWRDLCKTQFRGISCCSYKACLLNFLPGLSICLYAFTLVIYRLKQFFDEKQLSSEMLLSSRLVYSAIIFDLLVSLFHWTKQRRACNIWVVLNDGQLSSKESLLRYLNMNTCGQPLIQSLVLLVCLIGRPAITLLWVGVLIKERILLTHWSRISARLPQTDQTSLRIIMATHFWVTGWVTFYQQGNSHSIATLDFSVALVGMSEFHYYICGALLSLYTFAGPCFWHLQYHSRSNLIFPSRQNSRDRLMLSYFTYGMLSWPVTIFTFICIIMRNHLFVWSVFAPKLIYLAFTTVFMTPVFVISFIMQLF